MGPGSAMGAADGAPTAAGAAAAARNGPLEGSWSSCCPNATCLQSAEASTNVRWFLPGP